MSNRRCFTFLAVAAALALGFGLHGAAAQDWPTRPVTMVVPFAAGSASDTVARILGARLSEVLGQQVVIENVGGAGGMTGVARVAKAAPDGYQFVLGGVDTFAQNQTLYKKPLYNAADRFRAGRAGGRAAADAGRAQRLAGEQSAGVHRLREGQPGQDAIRLGRRRAPDPISPARSSTPRSASTSPTCPIAARRPRCRI